MSDFNAFVHVLFTIYLMRRQINKANEEEMEEDRIVMIDKKEKYKIKIIDNVLNPIRPGV